MSCEPCCSTVRKTQPRHHRGRAAFTLVEIMISASLMALILVSGYLCLSAAVATQRTIEPRLDTVQSARVAMALMAADLRSACPLSSEGEFVGMHRMMGEVEADNIDFATHNYTPGHAGEGDYCEESLFLDRDQRSSELILYRRRNPRIAPDPFSGGNREEIARGVLGLQFEYYDGLEWFDTWGDAEGKNKTQTSNRERTNVQGLPEAVRVTLLLESEPGKKRPEGGDQTTNAPPLMFQTVARLNLANSQQKPASMGVSTNTAAPPSAPGGGNP